MKLFTTKKITDNSIEEKSTNEISSKPKINYSNKHFSCKNNLLSKKFLVKKVGRFNVRKYRFNKNQNQVKFQKEGSLEEHIIFLQNLENYGKNWKKISKIIPIRSYKQIRSHAQKFYEKLKEYKDTELGIDFTSENINDFNDMIEHIKSVNINYNIVTTFLYLSEKVNLIKKSKKKDKININININNILCEDITKNINNNCNFYYENGNGFIDKEINNNNFTNTYTNNIFLKNLNNFDNLNNINNFVPLNQVDLHNDINSNFLKSRLLQNIPCNNINVYNNYYFYNTSVNLSDKNFNLDKLTNNIIFHNLENNKDNY